MSREVARMRPKRTRGFISTHSASFTLQESVGPSGRRVLRFFASSITVQTFRL